MWQRRGAVIAASAVRWRAHCALSSSTAKPSNSKHTAVLTLVMVDPGIHRRRIDESVTQPTITTSVDVRATRASTALIG